MNKKLFHLVMALGLVFSLLSFQSVRAAGVLFASPTGLTSGSCENWANACTLQYALSVAVDGDQIWVKMGNHKPTTSTTDRNASFALKNGVEIYGGFAGTENFKELRNPSTNLTILSGDIDSNDTNHPFTGLVMSTDNIVGGNSYHVVTANSVDDSAVLDGFTINAGHANGSAPHQSGAGMYNYNSSPTLANLYFMANLASGSGGGMYNYENSSPSLANVTFSANKADNGGGMYNYDVAHPTLANVTFQNNLATNTGGGMMNVGDSAPTLTDVIFHSNAAEVGGGGMTNYNEGNPTLTNVTFTENTAPYGGGGMYNTTSSPTLNNVTFEQNSDSYSGGGGMYNSSSTPTLNDVTFTQNTGYSGAGMYNTDSAPNLTGVAFFSNTAEFFGGGIYNSSSNMTSLYGHFSGNNASRGGGIYNHNSAPSFTGTVLIDNTAVTDGGGMYNTLSNPSLVNAIFSGNQAGEYGGGAFNSEQSPTFINVTMTNNSAAIYGGGIFNDYSQLDLANSIIWGNTAPNGPQLHNVVTQPTIVYSNIQGCGGSGSWLGVCGNDGGGNIDADPKFVDLGSNDLRLQLTSPAIDAGRNSNVPGAITLDMNASSRFVDVAGVADTGSGTAPIVDMGAFEAKEILYVAPAPVGIGDCSNWDNACNIWNAFVDAYDGNQMWVKQGVYKPTWDSSDREASFALKNGVEIYGGFAGNETTFSARNPVTNITVLSGDIDDNDTTNPLTGVVENYSNVSGENSYRIVTALGVDNTAVLDGFYVNAGQANGTYDSGAGLYTDGDPTLSNLQFVANSALMGSGLYNDGGSPALTNVVFLSNFANLGQGAGMYDSSLGNATLTNVTFNLNSADQGGGMYISTSSPTLTNVTFSANFGDYGGGLMNFAGTPVLTNVTFSNNSANSGGGIYNTNGGSPTLKNTILANTINGGDCVNNASTLNAASSHNLVEDSSNACGLTNGVNNNIVGQDPNLGTLADNGGFGQTHALPNGSAAIDAGTNTGCPATDQRGVARPQGSQCDIGAYEFVIPGSFTKSTPTNTATNRSLSPTLSWTAYAGATSYEYCYSSAPGPCTKWNSVGTNTSITMSGLAPNYTYYWQVRAVNAGGNTEADNGTWWSFTTTAAPACTFAPHTTPSTASFVDVPMTHWAWNWIERYKSAGLTTGCSWVPGGYCPGDNVTREQMAVFIMRAKNCGNYTPATVTSAVFSDVPANHWAAGFIRDFRDAKITSGCAWVPGGYCPGDNVTREQMAVFIIRAIHGGTYSPPAVTAPVFSDVPANHWAATFIKQFYDEGITTGCAWVPGGYCPGDNVTREQMAVFIGRAFGLP